MKVRETGEVSFRKNCIRIVSAGVRALRSLGVGGSMKEDFQSQLKIPSLDGREQKGG